jgi:hypothetical protein
MIIIFFKQKISIFNQNLKIRFQIGNYENLEIKTKNPNNYENVQYLYVIDQKLTDL